MGRRGGAVTIVRDLPGLDALRDGWDALGSSLPSPVQEFQWTRVAAEAFAPRLAPRVVVVHGPGGEPAAIAPLATRRRAAPRLETLGGHELFEPTDLLYEDEESLRALVHALARLRVPLVLSRLLVDSPVFPLLRDAVGRAAIREHTWSGAPVIELDDAWREPESQYDSRRRSDLRRARRRAESIGEVTTHIAAPRPEELGPLLHEAFAVEEKSWKGRQGTALARDPVRLPFFRRYAEVAAAAGTLRLCFLRIGGRAAAMQYAVESRGGFWLLKIGYDDDFGRASPGQLLMLETLRYAAERGLRTYEFLGMEAPWTEVWTRKTRQSRSVRVYPLAPASLAAAASDAAVLAARAVRTRLVQ